MGVVLSSFTCENLVRALRERHGIESQTGPYGKVIELALDATAEVWQPAPNFAFVWARPQELFPSFQRLLTDATFDKETWAKETAIFFTAMKELSSRVPWVFLSSFHLASSEVGSGLSLTDASLGGQARIWELNQRLVELAASRENIFILDSAKWREAVGGGGYDPKLYYLSKCPYPLPVIEKAAADIYQATNALSGKSKKVLVLDLDDTLWGGIVGDVGWENLRLGGHDAVGESFVEFQSVLKGLKSRGILLAIVSKNEEKIALEAMEKHSEMRLRLRDFAAYRINWEDKAKNVESLARELNLGLDSMVFIDDNLAERARVKETLPAVTVPEWPVNPLLYASALRALPYFDSARITEEDRRRQQTYQAESQRKSAQETVSSLEEWIEDLGIVATVEKATPANRPRIAQLFNKTNQFNLSSRRLSQSELDDWLADPSHELWTVSVKDRFGDSGLVGIVTVELKKESCQIVDMILSCRVFGRKIELLLLWLAADFAQKKQCRRLWAKYVPTEKNRPTLHFLKSSTLQEVEPETLFEWSEAFERTPPKAVTLEWK